MVAHLNESARRRTEVATQRASAALRALSSGGERVTFVAVAAAANVSTDFLYGHAVLRRKIEIMRNASAGAPRRPGPDDAAADTASTSAAVQALSAQVKALKSQHRNEIKHLTDALAAAHGENLILRRRLGGEPRLEVAAN